MKLNRTKSLTAFSFLLILGQSVPALAGDVFLRSPEKISQGCANYMSTFDSQIKALVADKSTATYQNVFAKFDNHLTEFADALLPDYLIQNVHTKEATRKAATACTLKGFAAFNMCPINV